MADVFICDGTRTPIGRYAGALSKVRTDDLAVAPMKELMARHPAFSGMDNLAWRLDGFPALRSWKVALREHFANKKVASL